ncbi:MAG: hypothetical protein Q7T55_01920 [Solirubrobacteraceae bacterium]|nr:hypothetical protein [Solirubrobacteraceae bacterium]
MPRHQGEAPGDWWAASGYADWPRTGDPADERETFYHDVDPALARDAASRGRADRTRGLGAWPPVATRYVLFRQDRFFPAPFVRSMVQDRLGISPDELDGSHCGMLSRPVELAAYLVQVEDEALSREGKQE